MLHMANNRPSRTCMKKRRRESSFFLNIRNMRLHQSSPFLPNPEDFFFLNMKKSQNHLFKSENIESIFLPKKKCYSLSFGN